MQDSGQPPAPKGEALLTFPCEYPLKVMGVAGSEFEAEAFAIVGRHVPDLDGSRVETRTSREGRYVSYTFHLTAKSREQLEALYTELNASDRVKAVL